MPNPSEFYELLIERAATSDEEVRELILGLTWTLCRSEGGCGLAMSPSVERGLATRSLPWPGTLAGQPLSRLAAWLRSWHPFEASVGMAAANTAINSGSTIPDEGVVLDGGNLAVFDYFLPMLSGRKVAVVGRYPGLERYQSKCDMSVLERIPGEGDFPDPAAEYLLPEADWVFLTASSITNKTFPRLAELSSDANLVLMGPTAPWLPELSDFGVDFLAGIRVIDGDDARSTVAEGGGVRLFDTAVRYCVADLGGMEMEGLKTEIGEVVRQRRYLKEEMDAWYAGTRQGSFPRRSELEQLDNRLSALDTRYKRLWDARFGGRSPEMDVQRDAA